MASLQARSPLRSAHLLLFLNKLVSLIALIVLLAAGWMAASYLRAELANRQNVAPDNSALSKSSKPVIPAIVEQSEPNAAARKSITAPLRLVYWCGGDAEYYHTQAHLPKNCLRTALSKEAAVQRGLKRCPVCLPE